MKASRYTEAQILAILREVEGGMPVAELCRAHGMGSASFCKWCAKYGGMDASMIWPAAGYVESRLSQHGVGLERHGIEIAWIRMPSGRLQKRSMSSNMSARVPSRPSCARGSPGRSGTRPEPGTARQRPGPNAVPPRKRALDPATPWDLACASRPPRICLIGTGSWIRQR